MKNNTKKHLIYLIYLRYSLPIIALLITFLMLFVPSYRFIFSGKVGELMSVSTLLGNSWEQAREVLFGTAEQTDAAIIFSRILFVLIIVFALLMLLSLCVSIWAATVAFRCFLSSDEDGAERSRRTFIAFVPNRIALCAFSSVGLFIAVLPYLMKPIYAFTYSQQVTAILEAPDALIVGSVLILATFVLSIVCAPIEKSFDADIFEKSEKARANDGLDDNVEEDKAADDVDGEAKERIRRLFDEDIDKNK